MKALLIIAHGSRREAANDEIENIANQVRQIHSETNEYEKVVHAFLEFAEPDIASAVNTCFDSGIREIDVVPYFLVAGLHVIRDIPNQLAACREQYPGLVIRISEHFGVMGSIAEKISECASMKLNR